MARVREIPSRSEQLALEPTISSEHRAELAKGAAEWDARQFFDAHETWEEIWQVERRPIRGFYQGLILLAGAFMLTPGFLTDAAGLIMLFPPTRKVVLSVLVRRYAKRVDIAGWSGAQGSPGGPRRFGSPLDAESYTKDTDDRSN